MLLNIHVPMSNKKVFFTAIFVYNWICTRKSSYSQQKVNTLFRIFVMHCQPGFCNKFADTTYTSKLRFSFLALNKIGKRLYV